MKKIYIQPSIKEVMLMEESQLMAGSGGPTAGDQSNPGMGGSGGGGSSRRFEAFDDDEDEEEDY